MQIQLRDVVPEFIEKEKVGQSQVWNKEIIVNKGDHLQIVAPSGRGKTSLIHFIYGLRNDYSGAILYNDTEIKNLSAEQFSAFRQGFVSIVFQDLKLFLSMTMRENLEIKRVLSPYHPASLIREMAAELGIEDKLDKPVKTCSYGEQQRIAIIRALLQPFDFLLLDEPFSHLDKKNILLAMNLITTECNKRAAGMVFADLEFAEFFNDRKVFYL